MGYDVRISDANFIIPTEHLDEALSIWKSMNTHPTYIKHKRSGKIDPQTGLGDRFSFLEPDYDEFVQTAEDMLDDLGFYTFTTEEGVVIYGFDNVQGQEELFLRAVEHLVVPNSYIEWLGLYGGEVNHWTETYNTQ